MSCWLNKFNRCGRRRQNSAAAAPLSPSAAPVSSIILRIDNSAPRDYNILMHKSTPPNADCITKTLISRSCGTIEREMYSGRTFYSNKICNTSIKLVEFVICEVFKEINHFYKSGRRIDFWPRGRFCRCAHFERLRRTHTQQLQMAKVN